MQGIHSRLAAALLAMAAVGAVGANPAEGGAGEGGAFVLEGDLSAFYASGDFVVWNPGPPGGGRTSGAMAMAMRPASSSQGESEASAAERPSVEDGLDVVVKAPLGEDGTFRVEAPAGAPRQVFFYVLNAVGLAGQRYAPTKGNAFLLEPGHMRLHMERPGRFHIEGGRYNDAVYNTWRRSPDYLAAQAEYDRLIKTVEGETEAERRKRVDAAMDAHGGSSPWRRKAG